MHPYPFPVNFYEYGTNNRLGTRHVFALPRVGEIFHIKIGATWKQSKVMLVSHAVTQNPSEPATMHVYLGSPNAAPKFISESMETFDFSNGQGAEAAEGFSVEFLERPVEEDDSSKPN